jgi:hypothetical protein
MNLESATLDSSPKQKFTIEPRPPPGTFVGPVGQYYPQTASNRSEVKPGYIINPLTKKQIKVGGQTHLHLVQTKTMDSETLTKDKVSIVTNSRQKMPLAQLQVHKKSTHLLNANEIANALAVPTWALLEHFATEFNNIKVIFSGKSILVCFPDCDVPVQDAIKNFVATLSNRNFNY